jgi:hypothetical protein
MSSSEEHRHLFGKKLAVLLGGLSFRHVAGLA